MSGKLLLDQNLSRRIVGHIASRFPGSAHVSDVELDGASDGEIWDFARESGFTITTKDADFHQMSFLLGAPPKVIWLRLGNCSTSDIINCLVGNHELISRFFGDDENALLLLDR